MKICLIGHMKHGKDTVAEMLQDEYGLTFKSSSQMASEIFIYDALKEKYGYTSPTECFEDRVNHRAEWHDLICFYNVPDRTKLATEILKHNDMYVGMRSNAELDACLKKGLFDYVIGVFDPRKPLEPESSFDIDFFDKSDFIILNDKGLYELRKKINNFSVGVVLDKVMERAVKVKKFSLEIRKKNLAV